jgi:hypothetical protein
MKGTARPPTSSGPGDAHRPPDSQTSSGDRQTPPLCSHSATFFDVVGGEASADGETLGVIDAHPETHHTAIATAADSHPLIPDLRSKFVPLSCLPPPSFLHLLRSSASPKRFTVRWELKRHASPLRAPLQERRRHDGADARLEPAGRTGPLLPSDLRRGAARGSTRRERSGLGGLPNHRTMRAIDRASSAPMTTLNILSLRRLRTTRWTVAPNASHRKQLGNAARKEQAPQGGILQDGAPGLGAEKGAGGAHTHKPGFRVDPLKGCSAQVPDRVPSRHRFDAAGGRRDPP